MLCYYDLLLSSVSKLRECVHRHRPDDFGHIQKANLEEYLLVLFIGICTVIEHSQRTLGGCSGGTVFSRGGFHPE
jgi:hypothetical protein